MDAEPFRYDDDNNNRQTRIRLYDSGDDADGVALKTRSSALAEPIETLLQQIN